MTDPAPDSPLDLKPTDAAAAPVPAPPPDPAARLLRRLAGAGCAAIAALSPWPYVCNEPGFEFLLSSAVLGLAALWAASALLSGRLDVRPCWVSGALLALAGATALQLVPLPPAVLGVVSPYRVAAAREYVPAELESGFGVAPAPPPEWLPVSLHPAGTRQFAARLGGLLALYLVARNWAATRESLPWLLWALAGSGALMALVAIMQAAVGRSNTILGLLPVESDAAFGPFISRSQYPDYAALALGAVFGLIASPVAEPDRRGMGPNDGSELFTPRNLALGAMLGVVGLSIPLSLSRGGAAACLGAAGLTWLLSRGKSGGSSGSGWLTPARLSLVGALAVGALALGWLGTASLAKRAGTVATGEAAESRLPLWRAAAKLIAPGWRAGLGAGSFGLVEPTVRESGPAGRYDNAHNEYLEALVEGGVARLGLTLVLAGAPLVVVARGYWARRGRSVAGPLLGLYFGLAAAALHAVVDFGLHLPAVAAVTAIAAAFGASAANDEQFTPARTKTKRVRRKRERGGSVTVEKSVTVLPPPAPAVPRRALSGLGALAVAAGVLILAGFCALEARRYAVAERVKTAAEALVQSDPADPWAGRAAGLRRRAQLVPDEPEFRYEAGQATLDAALNRTWVSTGALVGPGLAFAAPPTRPHAGFGAELLGPALLEFQAARQSCPVFAKVHGRIAVIAPMLEKSEPAAVHLARVNRLVPIDAGAWFAAGREAWGRGDRAGALAPWRHALALEPGRLGPILAYSARAGRGGMLSPSEVRAGLLPDSPGAWLSAARHYREAARGDAAELAEVRGMVARVLELTDGVLSLPVDDLAARAAALDELGRPGEAFEAYSELVARAPNRPEFRDRFADFCFRDDRYDEALAQLEWLRQNAGGNGYYLERTEAAKHGARLLREMRGETEGDRP